MVNNENTNKNVAPPDDNPPVAAVKQALPVATGTSGKKTPPVKIKDEADLAFLILEHSGKKGKNDMFKPTSPILFQLKGLQLLQYYTAKSDSDIPLVKNLKKGKNKKGAMLLLGVKEKGNNYKVLKAFEKLVQKKIAEANMDHCFMDSVLTDEKGNLLGTKKDGTPKKRKVERKVKSAEIQVYKPVLRKPKEDGSFEDETKLHMMFVEIDGNDYGSWNADEMLSKYKVPGKVANDGKVIDWKSVQNKGSLKRALKGGVTVDIAFHFKWIHINAEEKKAATPKLMFAAMKIHAPEKKSAKEVAAEAQDALDF